MTKLKNIVVVNDFSYIQGGASKVAINTANILNEAGYHVYFFTGDSKDKSALNGNIKVISTNQGESLNEKNKFKGAINNLYNVKAKNELKKLLKTLNPNETIVHYHGWTKCLSSSVFSAAYKLKFKTVVTLHDYFLVCPNGAFYDFKKHQIAELAPWQYLFRNCDSRSYIFQLFRILRFFIQNKLVKVPQKISYTITVSEFSKKIITRNTNELKNMKTIHNPLNIDKITTLNEKREDFFLFVGRLNQEKGPDVFCDAITKTQKKGIVVGNGPMLNLLKKKYKNIIFVGWKNEEDTLNYMRKALALIFTSKCYEAMPLTNIEALAMNTPSIVNTSCAASEISNKKLKTGITYKNQDELQEIINSYEYHEPNKEILYEFTKKNYREKLTELYSIVNNKKHQNQNQNAKNQRKKILFLLIILAICFFTAAINCFNKRCIFIWQ